MSVNLEELLGELDGIVGELHNVSGVKPPEMTTAQQFKQLEQERRALEQQQRAREQQWAREQQQRALEQQQRVIEQQQQQQQEQLRQEHHILQLQKQLMQAQQQHQYHHRFHSQPQQPPQPQTQPQQRPPVAPKPRVLSPPPVASVPAPALLSPRSTTGSVASSYSSSSSTVGSTLERKATKSASSLEDKRPGAATGKESLARNGSIRNAMMALFFSPLSKKEYAANNITIREGSQDSEDVPSLDGGEYDFSDEEEEEELQPYAQSATGGSLRSMPKSATMGNLADIAKGSDKGKEKEKDKDKDKGMRKSMSNNALEKAGRARSASLSEERVLNVTPFTYTPDPGSEIEISVHESGKLEVSAGSITDLVNFLAPTGSVDGDFISDFFFSYRYFLEAPELIDSLIMRFVKYNGKNEDDPSRLVPIRVLNVLRKWLQKHPYDFIEAPAVEEKLVHFLKAHEKNPEYSRYIASVFDILKGFKNQPRKLRIADAGFFGDTISSVRKKMQSIPVIRFDVKLVAKQLSLREMDLFQSVQLKELLHQVWANQKTSVEVAPNIFSYISWFNKTTSWVATEVCMAGNIRLRVSVLKFFITVARHCASWNNFNTVFEIVSGLSLPSVSRLKKTWASLPSKYLKTWQHLSAQLDPKENFKSYRALLKEAKLPCLPYIGVYLNDLVYAESGTSTFLTTGKVNFFKMATIAKALSSITHFQEKEYGFPMDKKMQQWFSFSMVVMDEDLLFKASLRCEPDEGDDE